MSNVLSISAIELVEKLKSGEISCVDACKEYIKRIDKFDKDVKAWAFFDKELLLENFITPNRLRFPLFRNILESYYK